MNRDSAPRRSTHDRVQAMLPWYANHTLEERDRAGVEAHLAHCSACRAEAGLHAAIAERICAARDIHPAPAGGFQALMERIEAHEASPARRWLRWFRERLQDKGLERALMAQAATILLLVVVLGWLVTRPEPPAEYRTLGTPAGMPSIAGPQLRLELHGTMTAAELKELLLKVDGQIVHGPTPQGVYIVELTGETTGIGRSPAEIAAWLRTQPGVEAVTAPAPAEPR
jgi:hypothetical protein